MKNSIITLLLIHLVFFGFAQDIGYEIRGTYKRPIVKEKLNIAKSLSDINPGYPSSWISNYVSVEILATCNGISMVAAGENDLLTDEQMSILKMSDMGTDIIVDVKYNPKSSLNDAQDIKVINFSYTLIPEVEAEYPGGYSLLKQYLKENAIDKITETLDQQLLLAKVKFTIDENGLISNAQISKTSEDEKIDQLLLEVINKMPEWKPASSNGIKVKQDFELSVGNIVGC